MLKSSSLDKLLAQKGYNGVKDFFILKRSRIFTVLKSKG